MKDGTISCIVPTEAQAINNLKGVQELIEQLFCANQILRHTVEEWNKDLEIQKAKEETKAWRKRYSELAARSFVITKEEQRLIDEWKREHSAGKHVDSSNTSTIGGRYTYRFTPTSIGEVGEVICSCGKSFCFREID